jgi:hypothetical protein
MMGNLPVMGTLVLNPILTGNGAIELPSTPKVALGIGWFGPDWQHLSTKGREVLAIGIVDILCSHKTDVRSRSKRLGTFGKGDQCFQWLANGIVQPMFTGATLVNLIACDIQRIPMWQNGRWKCTLMRVP